MDCGGTTSVAVRGGAVAAQRWLIAIVVVMGIAGSARAEGPALRVYESKHYVVHTDLPEAEAREAVVRVDRVAEEYRGGTAGFGGGGGCLMWSGNG